MVQRSTSEVHRAQATFRFVLGVLFTVPLLTNIAAQLLGWRIFLLADPKIQFLWGSLAQFVAGREFYVQAYRSLRSGKLSTDLAVAVGTTALYGFSVYRAFFDTSGANVYFLAAAGWITLALQRKRLQGSRET